MKLAVLSILLLIALFGILADATNELQLRQRQQQRLTSLDELTEDEAKELAKQLEKERKELEEQLEEERKAAEKAAKEAEEALEKEQKEMEKAKEEREKELEKRLKDQQKEAEKLAKELLKAEEKLIKEEQKQLGNELKEMGLEKYKEWKKELQAMRKIRNFAMKLNKTLKPIVKWYNVFAEKDVCTEQEMRAADKKLSDLFNSILDSRGFKELEWYETAARSYMDDGTLGGGGRKLRQKLKDGDERKLWYVKGSWSQICFYSSYLCRVMYPTGGGWNGNRRHLRDVESKWTDKNRKLEADEIEDIAVIDPENPEDLETIIADLKQSMEAQCESLLALIGKTSPQYNKDCATALTKVKCEAYFDLAELILPEVA